MPILHLHAEFLTEVILEDARVEMANLGALPLVPKILEVIGEPQIRIRVAVKLDRDIAVERLAFTALKTAITAAECLRLGILLPHGIADGQP